jgi:hypothetical protein
MTIRDQILIDLGKIENLRILYQVLEYLRLIRKNIEEGQGNIDEVLAFAGSLPEEDAKEISQDLENQFNEIEGEW